MKLKTYFERRFTMAKEFKESYVLKKNGEDVAILDIHAKNINTAIIMLQKLVDDLNEIKEKNKSIKPSKKFQKKEEA